MKKIKSLYKLCRKSNLNFLTVLFQYLFYVANRKKIISHNTIINGLKNIRTGGLLKIGVNYVGFVHKKDITFLNIKGQAEFAGNFSIGKGCRFDIGKNANVFFGKDSYINPFTNLIIMHKLKIGDNCAISWNCQFLDEDFHEIKYQGKKETPEEIIIGNKVWIGSNVCVYKGTFIPNGCVIASNSVVKGGFEEENVLIAGNPAKVIKRNISW